MRVESAFLNKVPLLVPELCEHCEGLYALKTGKLERVIPSLQIQCLHPEIDKAMVYQSLEFSVSSSHPRFSYSESAALALTEQ